MLRPADRPSGHVRQGVTLVEILVATAIVGLLVAVSIPAVQRSRATASRMQCASHLHQIGIAVHVYAETHGRLPLEVPSGGIFFAVLPALGQENEHARLEKLWDGTMSGQMQALMTAARIETFLCPEDEHATGPSSLSYAINAGMFDLQRVQRAFFLGGKTWSSVTDGMSQTVLCAEQRNAPQLPAGSAPDARHGKWFVSYQHSTPVTDADLTAYANACLEESKVSPPVVPFGADGYLGHSAFYNHIGGPNGPGCDSGGIMFSYPTRSNHTGGVNALMADGAVRFIPENIDLKVWRSLGSRDGGEIESASF